MQTPSPWPRETTWVGPSEVSTSWLSCGSVHLASAARHHSRTCSACRSPRYALATSAELLPVVAGHRRVVVTREVTATRIASRLGVDHAVEVVLPPGSHVLGHLGGDPGLGERQGGDPVGVSEVEVQQPRLVALVGCHVERVRRFTAADLHEVALMAFLEHHLEL